MGRYAFVEGIALADCAVEIEAAGVEDLFETAASALCDAMADPATVADGLERSVTLSAPELDLLLFDWLSELVYRKDRHQELFPRATVRVESGTSFRLEASLQGGRIDSRRTALRADVKGVTFHRFALERRGTGWRAHVVFDI